MDPVLTAMYIFTIYSGRTGIIGRGLLYRWGPNHAADTIVTRYTLLFISLLSCISPSITTLSLPLSLLYLFLYHYFISPSIPTLSLPLSLLYLFLYHYHTSSSSSLSLSLLLRPRRLLYDRSVCDPFKFLILTLSPFYQRYLSLNGNVITLTPSGGRGTGIIR